MSSYTFSPAHESHEDAMKRLRQEAELRRQGYRDRALKLFPHVCASCDREFSGKRLRELTVHHKDHNYKNNPPDGSNWELLCLFCHDHEHEKYKLAEYHGGAVPESPDGSSPFASPFADLDKLFTPAAEDPSAAAENLPAGTEGPAAGDDVPERAGNGGLDNT